MTATDLELFISRMRGWNRKRLGEELEISQTRLRRFLDGRQPIPRHISLACAALAMNLPPWPAMPPWPAG
jgi:hypothetical protein